MTISSTKDKGEIAERPYPKVTLVLKGVIIGNGKNTHDHSRASLQERPLHMTLFTEQKPATTGGQGWCRPNYPEGTDLQSVAFADSLLTHK